MRTKCENIEQGARTPIHHEIAIRRKCWKNQIKTSNSSGSSSNKHCSNFHLHIRLLLCRRGTSQTSQKHAHVRRSNDVGHQFFNVIG